MKLTKNKGKNVRIFNWSNKRKSNWATKFN